MSIAYNSFKFKEAIIGCLGSKNNYCTKLDGVVI